MKRRSFIASFIGLPAILPRPARAQPPVGRFGLLFPGPADGATARAKFIWDGLKEKGFVEGKTLDVVSRGADFQPDALSRFARELAGLDVRVIVAVGPPAVRAVKEATTKPIVAVDLESDPVESGWASSLAKPGGTITGLFLDFPEFSGKWLELLQEAVPRLARVAVLWDPTTGDLQVKAIAAAASARRVDLKIIEAREPSQFEGALAGAVKDSAQGLVVLSSPLFGAAVGARPIADLAARHGLPAISPFPEFAQFGGLMGYGASVEDMFRQAGLLVARVLNGESPADIPVERPTKLRLNVNVKAAKALGITLPPVLLARADEVIE